MCSLLRLRQNHLGCDSVHARSSHPFSLSRKADGGTGLAAVAQTKSYHLGRRSLLWVGACRLSLAGVPQAGFQSISPWLQLKPGEACQGWQSPASKENTCIFKVFQGNCLPKFLGAQILCPRQWSTWFPMLCLCSIHPHIKQSKTVFSGSALGPI